MNVFEGASTWPLVESRAYGTDTFSACLTRGQNDARLGRWKRIAAIPSRRVKTAGSSVTVDAVNTAANVFQHVAVGDSIRFLGPRVDTDPYRAVATVASPDQITVNRAIDLSLTGLYSDPLGYEFEFRTLACSTSAGVNKLPVSGWRAGHILLIGESESSATGGLDYRIEAYLHGAAADPQILASGNLSQANIAAGGPSASVVLGEFELGNYGWTHLRALVKVSAGSVVYSAYFVGKQ